MRYFVTIGDRTVEVDLTAEHPVVDGVPMPAELVSLPGTPVKHLRVDGRGYAVTAHAAERRGRWHVALGAERFTADAVDERTQAIRAMTGATEDDTDRTVFAPMPGLILKVEVEPGQPVRAGQGLVIVEAMKMENELRAPADGVVARVEVTPGQTVEKGAVLVVLE
jgi:pyruvate carboxylase subunit B